MSSVPDRPASSKRRHSQVYVEIPLTDRNSSGLRYTDEDRKENSPLKPLRTNGQFDMTTLEATKTPSHKRKLNDEDEDRAHDEAKPKTKKAKIATHSEKVEKKPKAPKSTLPKKSAQGVDRRPTPEDFPNGFFYCHQCSKKRDKSLAIQCTVKHESAKGRVTRCAAKYCKACLHNRYGEELDDLKSRNARSESSLSKKEKEKHVTEESYYFECYKCRNQCNCPTCQKNRGDEPLGNLKSRQTEKAAKDEPEKKAKSSSKARKANGTKGSEPSGSSAKASTSAKSRAKPKAKVAPKPKPMPKPVWTRVPSDLPLEEAEARIGIREFVLRFSAVLQIGHGHLEELDELAGENLGISSWDDDDFEGVEIYSWVSELCAKAVILGLVDILARHAEAKDDHAGAAAAKEAAKTIKGSGANLNRVWTALVTLKEALSLDIRSPLPPPSSTIFRHTRSGMQNGLDAIHIGSAAQVVPVIEDLIELVTESVPIREALDAGFVQEKEFTKEVKEAIASENADWKARTETKDKASREHHNQTLQDLEYCGRLVAPRFAPRYVSLGRDLDGRIYHVLSPGSGEYEAAIQRVHGHDGKVKLGKRRGMWTEDDRQELQKWSWFVSVWGRKPEGAQVPERGDDEESEEDEEDDHGDAWWGFWQPEEIYKLAEWISRKSNLPEDDPKDKSKADGSRTKSQSPVHAVNGVVKKAASSRGRTTSASSSLTSLTSSRSTRESSPLSDISSDEEDEDVEMRESSHPTRPPNVRELHALVKSLREYADVLQWRVKRVTRDASEEKDGKAAAVPTKRFYS